MVRTAGLSTARLAAVVFAIGASTWIIARAHREANPPAASAPSAQPSPDEEATGVPEDVERTEDAEPVFLPSSKSAIGVGGGARGTFQNREPKTRDPVFLPSSKSLPFTEDLGKRRKPAKNAPAPDAK